MSLLLVTILAGSGCFFGGPSRVHPPGISASAAGAGAMEQYDTNKDGVVKGEELDKAPSLKSAIKNLDTNSDGGVSADEVEARVKAWQDSKVGRMTLSCLVYANGYPLPDATVTFEPEKFLGDQVKACSGKTDKYGVASLSVPVEAGSDEPPGAACGLYLVRITGKFQGHDIPAKYNTNTILGKEIAQDSQEMLEGSMKIDLQIP